MNCVSQPTHLIARSFGVLASAQLVLRIARQDVTVLYAKINENELYKPFFHGAQLNDIVSPLTIAD